MADESPRRARRAQFALLGLAVLLAAGVVAGVLLTAGGDSDGASAGPEAAVRQLFDAIADGDASDAKPLMDPAAEADPLAVAFASSTFAPKTGDRITIKGLSLTSLTSEAGWAQVGAKGRYTIAGGTERDFTETFYLRSEAGKWLISTPNRFFTQFGADRTPVAKRADGLGPIGPQRPRVGEPVPDFALVDARDGTSVRKLSDFRGRPIVLNVYASWCGPCKEEIPLFEDVYRSKAGDVLFLGLNYQEKASQAAGILDVFKATYPALLDSDGAVFDRWRTGPFGVPWTFFIDRDGILRVSQAGLVSKELLQKHLKAIGVDWAPAEP